MEAYTSMVSEKVEELEEKKMMCEKCGKMHEGECEDEKEMDEAKNLIQ